jgi:hypothetical protein
VRLYATAIAFEVIVEEKSQLPVGCWWSTFPVYLDEFDPKEDVLDAMRLGAIRTAQLIEVERREE